MNTHEPRLHDPAATKHALADVETPRSASTQVDERITHRGSIRRVAARPELGALIGAVVIFAFFATQSPIFRSWSGAANWLEPASTLGVVAVAVALLLIGGEFDLS